MLGLKKVEVHFSVASSYVGWIPLKVYFYKEFLMLKCMTASFINVLKIIWKKYKSKHCISKTAFLGKSLTSKVLHY